MAESAMRKKVVKALAPLNAIAVENPCLPGTPDVNFIEGWIELKWLRSWPKKEETIVKLDHYSQQQKVWAFRRRRAGGSCWFMLQCGREWLIMDGAVAALWVNKCTKAELIAKSVVYFKSGLDIPAMIQLLEQKQDSYKFTTEDFMRLRENTP